MLTDRDKQIAGFAHSAGLLGNDLTRLEKLLEEADKEGKFNLHPGERVLPTGETENLSARAHLMQDFFVDCDWASLGSEIDLLLEDLK